MQRARICSYQKLGAAQCRHQVRQIHFQRNRRTQARRGNHLVGEVFLAWAKADDSLQSKLARYFALQISVAIGRPTFRAPPSAGAEYVKPFRLQSGEFPVGPLFRFRQCRQRETRHLRHRRSCSCRKGKIVFDLVRSGRMNPPRIEHRRQSLACVFAVKAESLARARSEGQKRRLVERLKIDGAVVLRAAQGFHGCDNPRRSPPIQANNAIQIAVPFQDRAPF